MYIWEVTGIPQIYFLVFISKMAISWRNKKQACVILSIATTEYISQANMPK